MGLATGVIAMVFNKVAMMIWGVVEGVQILEGKINIDGNGIKLKD